VDAQLVGSLLKTAANTSSPEDDRISAGIVKVFWQWDEQRITQLVRACIRLGFHLGIWKTAKGVVIPKPGKPDYSKVRAYRVISLLDVISKLLERTAAHLIADHPERKRGLHKGQFGCRKRRSCVDAVAILMNRTQKAWGKKKVAGALFMDVKSAFNDVDKTFLGKRMEGLGVEADLIRWTMSFITDRRVKLVLDGEVGEPNEVDTGVPQGSPAAPTCLSHTCRRYSLRWSRQHQASAGCRSSMTSGGGQRGRMTRRSRPSCPERQRQQSNGPGGMA